MKAKAASSTSKTAALTRCLKFWKTDAVTEMGRGVPIKYQAAIERVNSNVDQRSAAGALLLREPAADA